MSWFSDLTGIRVETPQTVRDMLTLEGTSLVSAANGRRCDAGVLTTPYLAELRRSPVSGNRPVLVQETVANVQILHTVEQNAGAAFQVASQFNLLEMIGPEVTPEDGVSAYEYDMTQGPACAIVCGAGTIYRNYFAPVRGGIGQSRNRQIDCLEDLGNALDTHENAYWNMQNGYALLTQAGLSQLNTVLTEATADEKDRLRGLLRIGVQSDTEVTFQNAGHAVTQLFCSAMPVSYGDGPAETWEEIARLVLEAAYEATLLAAVRNAAKTGNNRVFLTRLGGGAFGNKADWIADAMIRAIGLVSGSGLEIHLVSFGASNPVARTVVAHYLQDQS